LWNLVFIVGVVAGGLVGGVLLRNPHPVAITAQTQAALASLGIHDFSGLAALELPPLIAVLSFFAAGAAASRFLLPPLVSR
jgi:hypothetical protein